MSPTQKLGTPLTPSQHFLNHMELHYHSYDSYWKQMVTVCGKASLLGFWDCALPAPNTYKTLQSGKVKTHTQSIQYSDIHSVGRTSPLKAREQHWILQHWPHCLRGRTIRTCFVLNMELHTWTPFPHNLHDMRALIYKLW